MFAFVITYNKSANTMQTTSFLSEIQFQYVHFILIILIEKKIKKDCYLLQVLFLKLLWHTSCVELPARHNVTFHRQQNIQEEESDLLKFKFMNQIDTHTHKHTHTRLFGILSVYTSV